MSFLVKAAKAAKKQKLVTETALTLTVTVDEVVSRSRSTAIQVQATIDAKEFQRALQGEVEKARRQGEPGDAQALDEMLRQDADRLLTGLGRSISLSRHGELKIAPLPPWLKVVLTDRHKQAVTYIGDIDGSAWTTGEVGDVQDPEYSMTMRGPRVD
jgi:hypothetical protein